MGMLLYMMELQKNNEKTAEKKSAKVEGVAEKVAPSKPDPAPAPVKEKIKETKPEYTEEKLKAMNGTQLRKLAKKHGIENPEEFTVGELKATLIGLLVG